MLSSFPRKDATAKVAREHVKVALIMLPRRFLAFLLRKRFLSTEKKRKERERDVCAVCPTFKNLCKSEFWLKFNWPKIRLLVHSIFGQLSTHILSNLRYLWKCIHTHTYTRNDRSQYKLEQYSLVIMSKPDAFYHAVVNATIPISWFSFKKLLASGDVELKANERRLSSYLLLTYTLCAATVVGQVMYYYSLTSTDFIVSQEWNLTGHSCRPLQKDPSYGLEITYDECMASYEPVTNEGMMLKGTFDPYGYIVDKRTGEYIAMNNGPWNYSSNFGYNRSPLFDGIASAIFNTPTTYFHKPLPKLSQQAYTYSENCVIPNYPGFEKTPDYASFKGSVLENSLLFAYEIASENEDGHGYGPYALCNKDPSLVGIQQDDYYYNGSYRLEDHNFHPMAGTDFVSQCSGTFTTEMQSDLYVNGGYVAPHLYGTTLSWFQWFIDADGETVKEVVKTNHRSVGMTPMYPKSSWDQLNLPPMSVGTFFGIPRCDFYERQMSKEAYEFVYSHENCHPCDGFKFNTPFYCEKQVRKTAGEIIALSVSNTLALFGFLLAVGPALLKLGDKGAKETRETNENNENA